MTLFVDASALVAIIAGEAEAERFAREVMADNDPLWSALSCWETIRGLRASHRYALDRAQHEVEMFAESRPLRLVPIAEAERREALRAFQRYGKGNHAAQLNFGDCFAYACARTNEARLLYKGNDFARTDLA